jgi:hypothetical protein
MAVSALSTERAMSDLVRPFRIEVPGGGARRPPQPHRRDTVARAGDGYGRFAGRASRDDSGARALLGPPPAYPTLAEEIAKAAVFLASDEPAYMHSSTLLIDGVALSTRLG